MKRLTRGPPYHHRGLPDPPGLGFMPQTLAQSDGCRGGIGVSHLVEFGGFRPPDPVRDGPGPDPHHRQTRCRGLGHRQAEGFGGAGGPIEVGPGQHAGQGFPTPDRPQHGGVGEARGGLPEPLLGRALADQDQVGPGFFLQAGVGLQDQVELFFRAETAGKHRDGLLRRHGQDLSEEGGLGTGTEDPQVHPEGDEFEVPEPQTPEVPDHRRACGHRPMEAGIHRQEWATHLHHVGRGRGEDRRQGPEGKEEPVPGGEGNRRAGDPVEGAVPRPFHLETRPRDHHHMLHRLPCQIRHLGFQVGPHPSGGATIEQGDVVEAQGGGGKRSFRHRGTDHVWKSSAGRWSVVSRIGMGETADPQTIVYRQRRGRSVRRS